MTRRNSRWSIALAGLLLTAAGCDDLVAPRSDVQVADQELKVLPVGADAPSLVQTELHFYAVRGEERRVEMVYETGPGYSGSGKCLLLIVPSNADLRRPDGTLVAMGDSIRIDVRIMNSAFFRFEFQPSGLHFGENTPARLEIRYHWADFDGDGQADLTEDQLLSLYQQESPGQSWSRVPSTQDFENREIHARITGFTRYALASD